MECPSPSPGDSPISEKSLVDPSDEDVSNDNAEREGEKEGEKKEEGEDKEEGNKSVCVCLCLCVMYVHVLLGVGAGTIPCYQTVDTYSSYWQNRAI